MAIWDLLQNLNEFDFRSVTSDGIDIYFAQYGGGLRYHVFKYTVATDTVSQISNDASFDGTTPELVSNLGAIGGSSIQFFGGNLYACVVTLDATSLRVYRYNGTGTAWTNVLTATPGNGKFALFCTGSHLIVAGAIDVRVFDWAKFSADGSTWNDATVSNVPAHITTSPSRLSVTYGQGISPVFIDNTSHAVGFPDPDVVLRWFEWDGAGSFDITHSTQFTGGAYVPADEWLRATYFRDLFHWSLETSAGTIWKYAATLGDAWTTPASHLQNGAEIYPVTSIGFTEQAGDCDGDFVLLTSGVWETPEVVTGGTGGISHVVKMDDGAGFLFAALGAQAAIYGRSEVFPAADAGNRLWVYKSSDWGITWTSRGIKT